MWGLQGEEPLASLRQEVPNHELGATLRGGTRSGACSCIAACPNPDPLTREVTLDGVCIAECACNSTLHVMLQRSTR
jgi:hypothetical protein